MSAENPLYDAGNTQCLECGALLSPDASACDSCGNAHLILPSRWVPPEEGKKPGKNLGMFMRKDTRVLLSLSIALFIALSLLSNARARTEALINGKSPENRIVFEKSESLSTTTNVPEPDSRFQDDINALREAARTSDALSNWSTSVQIWSQVLNYPEAEADDFLALANALEKLGNIQAANEILSKAIAKYPQNPSGYFALGNLDERQGLFESARAKYKAGLLNFPEDKALAEGLTRVEKAIKTKELQAIQPVLRPEETPMKPLNQYMTSGLPNDSLKPESAKIQAPQEKKDEEKSSPAGKERNRVTLIGEENSEKDTTATGGTETEEKKGSYLGPVIEILDLAFSATSENVLVQINTSGPVELHYRSASNPPRLVLRLSRAAISSNAHFPENITVNTPLVDRITMIQSPEEKSTVIFMIYLGEDARYSVSSDSMSVRVNISKKEENN